MQSRCDGSGDEPSEGGIASPGPTRALLGPGPGASWPAAVSQSGAGGSGTMGDD